MSKYNLEKVIRIPEKAGLYVTDHLIEVVGPAEITVFDGSTVRIVQPGQAI